MSSNTKCFNEFQIFQDSTKISSITYSNYHKIEENFTTSSKSQHKSTKICYLQIIYTHNNELLEPNSIY